MGFLRKVYGLLSVQVKKVKSSFCVYASKKLYIICFIKMHFLFQLALTTLIAGVCMFQPVVTSAIRSNPWLIMVAFILSIGLLVALQIKRKETPINLILLAAFVSYRLFWFFCFIFVTSRWNYSQKLVFAPILIGSSFNNVGSRIICSF